ncbi:MAG: cytochrome c [Paracoccaceae bacterium]|nr:cytochrome c [Paracoccaceae bacterium]
MHYFFQPATLIILTTTFLITLAPIATADDTDRIIKARMNAMKDIASGMKSLAHIIKGRDAFSADKLKEVLAALENKASETPGLFEKYAISQTSEAGAKIWENFDDFTKKAYDLERFFCELALTIQSKDHQPNTMKPLGSTCKACHSKYRN